jgi:hypothetical protein
MSDINYYNVSLEIIHQHDITVVLVHLRVKHPSAIGRNCKTGIPLSRLFLHHENLPYLPRGKAEEFDDRMLRRLRVDEVDAPHHRPSALLMLPIGPIARAKLHPGRFISFARAGHLGLGRRSGPRIGTNRGYRSSIACSAHSAARSNSPQSA